MKKRMKIEASESINIDLLIRLTQDLVRIPTQNPPGNEKGCAEYIYSTLSRWGVETKMISEPFPHRPQIMATVNGKETGPTLILNGHMDVVPEGSRSQWKYDPYGGVVEEGRIYGRGSSDMKGGLAAMMMLAKLLHEKSLPRGKVIFQFVMGEETGESGTKHLLRKSWRAGL